MSKNSLKCTEFSTQSKTGGVKLCTPSVSVENSGTRRQKTFCTERPRLSCTQNEPPRAKRASNRPLACRGRFLFEKSGLVALVGTLLGCSQEYPQYSGDYKLDITGVEYAPEDFRGEKKWPENLEIVHRMEYRGAGFDHYLGFEFKAGRADEAEGRNVFKLSKLTYKDQNAYPNETPDGEQIYAERKIYGGAFCNSQVQYWVFARVFPDHQLLDEVYENHAGTIGIDPVTGMELKISPSQNRLEEQFNEKKADEWFELAENKTSIEITILRHLDSTTDGCYQGDGYLPSDRWGDAWSKARYFSLNPNYETNLITAGLEDLGKSDELTIGFFQQIIPDVGSTDY